MYGQSAHIKLAYYCSFSTCVCVCLNSLVSPKRQLTFLHAIEPTLLKWMDGQIKAVGATFLLYTINSTKMLQRDAK